MSNSFLHMKGRTALQPVSAALEMNPKERALYLKQKHTGVTLTDDEATVASATAAGLRSFLRQASSFQSPVTSHLTSLVLSYIGCLILHYSCMLYMRPEGLPGTALAMQMREELYQILGGLASSVAGLYQATVAQPAWVAALVGDLDMLTNQQLRLAMRHIFIALVKACPPMHRHVRHSRKFLEDNFSMP